ncbi:outer membrane protein assembly factor BamE [mine drainage metagenome]|uniref:Outer membrane protein assembly factor BamE n=1 Tax=mine drainage metagenome TaxID=410659 RepID=A0A1J5RCP5_9ZZZZ
MRPASIFTLFAAALTLSVGACTPTIDIRGNVPPPERLKEIKPGEMGKNDVMALLGTPSDTSTFGDDAWYYVSSKVSTYAFYPPEEIERQVVEIKFNRQGKVISINTLGLKDGKEIDLITKTTPAPGRDLTVLEQLLGNVGRFSGGGATPGTGP